MPEGTIHRTIRLLHTALNQLNCTVPPESMEKMGVMVNSAMSVQNRSFHTPDHIFSLADPENPYMSLAALYHDIVYYQVDDGFLPEIESIVSPYIRISREKITLIDKPNKADIPLALCLGVFGFQPGQELSPFGGMNEFLSALVMACQLHNIVSLRDLLITAACIEATIPFRGRDEQGNCPSDRLKSSLQRVNAELNVGISDEDLDQATRWAVTFANRDVENFSEEDVAKFLDNTWRLLPETNPALRMKGMNSISSYRIALQKMEGFLRSLDPRTIFCTYLDTPSGDAYQQIVERANRNVMVAREYLAIKLLTASILEALALISGGDAPIAYFMGEMQAGTDGPKVEDYLPIGDVEPTSDMDATVHTLLAEGRASDSSFDLKHSPLSLFIYLHLGMEGTRKGLESAKEIFTGDKPPKELLDAMPAAMIGPIAKACSVMAFTREEALLSYAESRGY